MNINLKEITYHLTSTQTKPNKVMKEKVVPYFLEHDVKTVLDYGCGKYLRDSVYLSKEGFIVDAVDLEEQVQRIELEKAKLINNVSTKNLYKNYYDASLLNFVLQVLPTKKQRENVLEEVCSAIKDEGYLVLSLMNQNYLTRCENRISFKDGFITHRGMYCTFIKTYERTEIEKLLNKSHLKIINITKIGDSFITLSQK